MYSLKPIYSTRSISMHGFRYVFCISSEMDNCRQGLELKVGKYVLLSYFCKYQIIYYDPEFGFNCLFCHNNLNVISHFCHTWSQINRKMMLKSGIVFVTLCGFVLGQSLYKIGVGIGDCTGPAAEVNMVNIVLIA